MVREKLNVTSKHGGDGWCGYVVREGRAVKLVVAEFGDLDALRDWAERYGFDGILIGAPSVDWAEGNLYYEVARV